MYRRHLRADSSPTSRCPSNWEYIKYPPTQEDFHQFVKWSLTYKTDTTLGAWNMSQPDWKLPNTMDRLSRVIFGGLYSVLLKSWFTHFSTKRFMVIPVETFWRGNVVESMTKLQRMLNLPNFDYGKISSQDKRTGRYRLHSISTDLLTFTFNAGQTVPPMREDTKQLLDNLFCDSNRAMQQMLDGKSLPGYSCTT